MFINNGKSHLTNLSFEDNLISLNNIDYFKRYIIIENPIPGQMNQITVINISSATGRDSIGIMSDSERFQTTNIYHCYGNVLTFDGKINANSMIFVSDASYGMIDFDYNRPQSFEFMNTVSYTDLLCNTKNFHKLPNIRFYNIAHHMLNEDLCRDSEFENGSIFIQKIQMWYIS